MTHSDQYRMNFGDRMTGAVALDYVRRLFLTAALVSCLMPGWGGIARADDRECPSHPEATYVLSGDPDSDSSQIARLADAAKQKGAVCIMAFYDAQGPSNSKMLAFRRANWVMERFNDHGVSSSSITRVLHAADKSSSRMVQIILGP
jgi:hypothetical protein